MKKIINIFKNYWYREGRWHHAECDSLMWDEGICECKSRKIIAEIKRLLTTSK